MNCGDSYAKEQEGGDISHRYLELTRMTSVIFVHEKGRRKREDARALTLRCHLYAEMEEWNLQRHHDKVARDRFGMSPKYYSSFLGEIITATASKCSLE